MSNVAQDAVIATACQLVAAQIHAASHPDYAFADADIELREEMLADAIADYVRAQEEE